MLKKAHFHPKTLRLASGIAAVTMIWSGSVQAQDSSPEIESVVITGSRIARDGFDKPTPVSVLSEEDIYAEAPASVADFVASMPSVQGSSNASSTSASLSSGGAGIAALNLRSLGTGRSLVLFDGQRSVVSAATGQIDTNTFPQPLIERVEIVTGGASSAYGSDAISGVVNFILDKDFTGFKTNVEYGQTTYGDNDNVKYNLSFGTPFADGAGHVLFSSEFFDMDGVHYETRDWAERGYWAMINPDTTPGAPHFLITEGIGLSSYTPGGLITAGPLRGTYFGEGGSVNQLEYGQVAGQWMLGGDWQYTNTGQIGTGSLAADEKRESVFGRVSYELSPAVSVFGQYSWAAYKGLSFYLNPEDRGIRINADNAFLPASIRQSMSDLGLGNFTMGTANAEFGASGNNNERETARYVVGANGEFFAFDKSWTWDAYYQKGITDTDEHMLPTFNTARLRLATDAVFHPDTNEIVCRSSIANPGNGCVPINRFGLGVSSQESLDYVLGRPRRTQEFEQDVAAFNISTNDFEGWAGPISLAFGAEWREESITGDVEPQYQSGWKYGNYLVTEGSYDVAEAYIETLIPLTDTIDFNGAARYTDYSTSGEVSTWKAGLTWAPIDDLTFRLAQSLDIRAPNLSEMFATGTARTNSVGIGGQAVSYLQYLVGSTSVMPEEADTLGVGLVMRPGFLPGLAASIDYYDIEVSGVIDALEPQVVADYCTVFNVQQYCDMLVYENGVLQRINLTYANLNSLKASGVDYEISYGFDLDQLVSGLPGEVTIRGLLTNYMENITDDGVTITDTAGMNTSNTPDWVYRWIARYSYDDWMVNLTVRGVSDGVVNHDYIECTSGCPVVAAPQFTINENDVKGRTYVDLYLAKTLAVASADAELFLSVKNLFDLDPVVVHDPSVQGSVSRPGFVPTNRQLYDVMGRNFRLGLRMEF